MYASIKVLRIFRKEFFGISLDEISHVLARLFACNVASPGYFPVKEAKELLVVGTRDHRALGFNRSNFKP